MVALFLCSFFGHLHLKEADRVGGYHGVIAGYYFLGWNIKDDFHHVNSVPNRIYVGDDYIESGF